MTARRYKPGQRFAFTPGQRVICNGYPGTVIQGYFDADKLTGMVEVRLASGSVCVSSSYPDCYPAKGA